MPRTSQAAQQMFEVVTDGNVEVVRRLRPPLQLTPEQTQEFQRVVSQTPADHFFPGNLGMLIQYCRHFVMAQHVANMIETAIANPDTVTSFQLNELLKTQARETKVIAQLMTQLRLTPQSTAPRTVPQSRMHEVQNPWSTLVKKTPAKITRG